MKNNLYKVLVIIALAMVMLSACSAGSDDGGKCGGICSNKSNAAQVYEILKDAANK